MSEEPPVNLALFFAGRHVNQISQVSDENSLEDVLVEVAGIVVVAGLHQNSGHRHPPASTRRLLK